MFHLRGWSGGVGSLADRCWSHIEGISGWAVLNIGRAYFLGAAAALGLGEPCGFWAGASYRVGRMPGELDLK
jgi:hypothetical protein